MNTINRKFICALGLCLLPATSQASIINFDFTGRFIMADSGGGVIYNNGIAYTDISASLSFNTATGLGGNSANNNLSITMNGDNFFGFSPTFHDISMTRQGSSNLIDGTILVDWNGNNNMPLYIEWDATGLFTAVDLGLQAGDVLSGTNLYYDSNENGVFDAGIDIYRADIGSAIPYLDFFIGSLPLIVGGGGGGLAPMAATGNSIGMTSGPFTGFKGYFDIGTGNSIHITSVSAVFAVFVPAAVWLFGSGLLALIGVARRKTV